MSDTRGRNKQARGEGATPEDPHGLTDRQRLFVSAYLGPARGNATQAAIAAGYSPDTAASQGSRLLRNAKVAEAVGKRTERLLQRHDVTADRVLQELAHVAFLDIGRAFDSKGNLLSFEHMPEEVRRAIASVDVDELWDGFGEERAQTGVTRKVRVADKLRALELLGKHLKLFTDKVDLAGADGGPLQVSIAINRTVKGGG